jgi:hypothetical protein
MKTVYLGGPILALVLTGCGAGERLEGAEFYRGTESVLATGEDQGLDSGTLINGQAAIAYDPDGCQNWVIDDGLEGYATPRYDPRTGRPVCNGDYPPGTVLGTYETSNAGIDDRVSGHGRKTVVRKVVRRP